MVQPYDNDPGWLRPIDVLLGFVPGLGIARAQRGQAILLQQFRLLFMAFTNAVVLIGVMAVFMSGNENASVSAVVAAGIAAAVGVMSLVVPQLVTPPFDGSAPETVIGTYRTRFFLRLAFAEMPALVGFVGVILSGEWWVYLVGGVFAAVGFVRIAPTEANVRRDQEALYSAGSGVSLVVLLTTPVGPPTPGTDA